MKFEKNYWPMHANQNHMLPCGGYPGAIFLTGMLKEQYNIDAWSKLHAALRLDWGSSWICICNQNWGRKRHKMAWHHQIISRLSFTWLYLDSCLQNMCISFCLTTDPSVALSRSFMLKSIKLKFLWLAAGLLSRLTPSLDSPFPHKSHYKPLAQVTESLDSPFPHKSHCHLHQVNPMKFEKNYWPMHANQNHMLPCGG